MPLTPGCRTESEIKELDTKARVKLVAQNLVGLDASQKLSWAIEHKNRGNSLYKERQFDDAIEIYLEVFFLDLTDKLNCC